MSPEGGYFAPIGIVAPSPSAPRVSRFREEWEELEFLVSHPSNCISGGLTNDILG
jgi:hypothetical protein